MLRLNGSFYYSNEYYLHKSDNINSSNSLILPIIGGIIYDFSSLRIGYFYFFLILILIGLINNIFSFMTFTREHIRYTISGVYLIIYSLCSFILIILISTNLISIIYYENYYYHLWTCHGYPYLSLIMIYTSILMSVAIAIEEVLKEYFNIDKFRSPKPTIILSILILIIVSISNLDKIFTRRLIIDRSNNYLCIYNEYFDKCSSIILNFIYIILPCLIHLICLVLILLKPLRKNFLEKFFFHQKILIPSLFIILCLLLNIIYRYLFHFYFINLFKLYQIRLHIGFLCLFYLPQILTYMIYIYPNDFYIKQFYEIWFYRKLCCCFYNRQRHVQEFVVINRLWQSRTSLETIRTIPNFDDFYLESEFYAETKY